MKIADLFARLGLRTDKGSFAAGNRLLGGVKKAVIGLGAFLSVRYFTGLIRDTAATADQFAKMSKKIGISVQDLRQLEFAAGISGSNIGQLRVGLQRFARVASDSQRGLKTARDAMKDANVEWRDGAGGLRDLDAMLMDVADQLQGMPDGTKKTALAMELFGRSGAELIPLLNEGSAGIAKLRKEFDELDGGALADSAKSFEEFNDDQLRVKVAMQGLRNEMVIALLPTLKNGVKTVLAWVKANRELLKQKIRKFAVTLGKVLVEVGKALLTVGKLVAWMIKNWKTLSLLLLPLALLFGKIKLALVGVAAALSWFFDLLGRPPDMGLFEAIEGTISEMGGAIKDTFRAINDFVRGVFSGLISWFGDKIDWVVDKARRAAQFVEDFAKAQDSTQFGKTIQGRRARRFARRLSDGPTTVRASELQGAGGGGGVVTNNTTNTLQAEIKVDPSNPDSVKQQVIDGVREFWNSEMRVGVAGAGG